MTDREHDQLLFADACGTIRDIAWVCEHPMPERIPKLRLLLTRDDLFVTYLAAQILASWRDPIGLDALESLVDRGAHERMEFAPHRIYDYDNVYDELASALPVDDLESREQCVRICTKLLALYGPCDFMDHFKQTLLRSDFPELMESITTAISRSLALGKHYLASQLLPPLARFDAEQALALFPRFLGLKTHPNPLINVAEALRFVAPERSRPQLRVLFANVDRVVSDTARQSFAALAGMTWRSSRASSHADALRQALRDGKSAELRLFWGHHAAVGGALDDACLSQWWPSAFTVEGVRYPTAEHYMMAEKARLFGDIDTRAQILDAQTPLEAKALGRAVRGFDDGVWAGVCFDIVVAANVHKFGRDPLLRTYLMATGDAVLIEASPVDAVWGIGLAETDPAARDPLRWRGANLLGFALMQARAVLGR